MLGKHPHDLCERKHGEHEFFLGLMAVAEHSHMIVLLFVSYSWFVSESRIGFSSARSMKLPVLITGFIEFVVAAIDKV